MRAYVIYKDKSEKSFRKLINAGSGIFDSYRTLATKFIKYSGSDLDAKIAEYDKELEISSIKLEKVFPTKFRWLISDVSLRTSRNYLKSIEGRITEFQGKEDNLKILVGILFIKFVLITKLVETYCTAAISLKKNGKDVSNLTLEDIGIDNKMLKYFSDFEDLSSKSIDDWLKLNIDPVTSKHFYSSMKRMLKILMSTND